MAIKINFPISGLVLLCLLFFASCGKDENPTQITNNLLQGEWEVQSWIVNGQQLLGNSYSRMDIEFKSICENAGYIELRGISTGGSLYSEENYYVIAEDGKELELGESENLFDIDFDGNDEVEMTRYNGSVQFLLERD